MAASSNRFRTSWCRSRAVARQRSTACGSRGSLEQPLGGHRPLQDPGGDRAGRPGLLASDGPLQQSIQRLPAPWRIFCESSGLAALTGGRGVFRGHTKTCEDHSRAREVAAVKGAALAVRRRAFDEIGGFDESFFLFAQETDLLAPVSPRGPRIPFLPGAEVAHARG